MRSVETERIRRRFGRAAATSIEARRIEREVERRMCERLEFVRLSPARVLDAGCGAGEGMRLLSRRYPDASVLGVDSSFAMAREARRSRGTVEWVRKRLRAGRLDGICGDLIGLPLAPECVDLVWANLALNWVADLRAALQEFHRVLTPGGLLMFSVYGPGTLSELRNALALAGLAPRMDGLADMHDVGDLLVATRFGDPVMDADRIVLDYFAPAELLRELRLTGQSSLAQARRRGLSGRRRWEAALDAYRSSGRGGSVPATVEVLFGHAWKPQPRNPKYAHRIVPIEARGAQRF